MCGVPTTFWGKLRQQGDNSPKWQWQPLIDHRAEAGAVAVGLLSPRVWQHRLASTAGRERDAAAHALPGSQAEAGT